MTSFWVTAMAHQYRDGPVGDPLGYEEAMRTANGRTHPSRREKGLAKGRKAMRMCISSAPQKLDPNARRSLNERGDACMPTYLMRSFTERA